MSNKSFFVLLGAILSPFAIIRVAERVGAIPALFLFVVTVLYVSSHFRRAKDF